jgi:hypothetical protein
VPVKYTNFNPPNLSFITLKLINVIATGFYISDELAMTDSILHVRTPYGETSDTYKKTRKKKRSHPRDADTSEHKKTKHVIIAPPPATADSGSECTPLQVPVSESITPVIWEKYNFFCLSALVSLHSGAPGSNRTATDFVWMSPHGVLIKPLLEWLGIPYMVLKEHLELIRTIYANEDAPSATEPDIRDLLPINLGSDQLPSLVQNL